jgi:sulfate transport system ATP-binding protein
MRRGCGSHIARTGLASEENAIFYVRPHEIDLSPKREGVPGIAAEIVDIRRFGGLVRIELERKDGGEPVEAEMNRSEFKEKGFSKGQAVVIQPKQLKTFAAANSPD